MSGEAGVADPMLRVRGLTRHFGGLPAVDGVDLDVAAGEVVAVVGPNGAGKSTLLQLINGMTAPSAPGIVTVDGDDVLGRRPHEIRRAGVATVLQTPRMFPSLTVVENAMVGAMFGQRRHRPGGRFRAGHGSVAGHVSRRQALATATGLLDRLGLGERRDDPVGSLTLHQQRRLELARALAGRPRVVLLDEVMAGLNPSEVDGFVGVLDVVRRDTGAAVVWVEHVMRAVSALADRVVVMHAGRQLAEGTTGQVMRHPEVIRAYLGREGHGRAAR